MKANREVLHLEQRSFHCHLSYCRGSKISLKPSPRRLNPRMTTEIVNPGKNAANGWSCKNGVTSFSINPQLGVGGGSPSPKKLSDDSARIAWANSRLKRTS